ncbi:citrinin biosynthesis oxidoreductase CtnB [Ophiocordyceps camponoti-floridani]|uniref:Citrinin biosynthesis oxidoreductase CtnB n=1 Tax=Ophiocordyceps camponoti-floridani TaxID=2030778 RepID=A0A8H4VDR2_9HYPO|nr:citrinin biosynthesis oxidoreductase CtnB [Ophiocordyceps camponoti-floridani]
MTLAYKDNDLTIHLPRILCLHGGGTNARIFRMQTRAFKHHIGQQFRFVFAQAPFPSKPGPDVTSVYSEYGPFRSWLRPYREGEDAEKCGAEASDLICESIANAIREDDELGATGDVVGVLGFSQGARMAASLLYNQQLGASTIVRWPKFRFAVLLAGRGKLVWLMPDLPRPEGVVDPIQPVGAMPVDMDAPGWDDLKLRDKLQLPTVHVHGLTDDGLPFHRQLVLRYCLPGSSTVIEWQGEHRVPIKTKDVRPVVEQMVRLAA